MTTNRDWLFSLPLDEQIAWMNAEHQDGTLDGDTAALNAKIAELTAERDKLKELNGYHAVQYELASEDCDRLQAQVDELTQIAESKRVSFADRIRFVNQIDELTAERDNWKEHSRTIEYRCKKAETDCEIYRKKFGKCLDYADAIHALMDEGIA